MDKPRFDMLVETNFPPTDQEIMQSYSDKLWYEDKKGVSRLDENVFAEAFSEINHLLYNNGLFYTRDGKATEEVLAKSIWESIKELGIKSDVEKVTKKLLGAVKLASTVPELTVDTNIIPFSNGDFYIKEWTFHESEFIGSPYRLKTELPWLLQDTPNFNKWLSDLFYEDDIKVVQEYLGYSLVPTTRAQKALFLVGDAGAGKSVIGEILKNILGDALLSTRSSQEFMQDKFKLPELEHKLVLYDDDLSSEALKDTGLYKKLITNNQDITADRKYGQPFKFKPYAKIISCCNNMLSSIYDNTDGFYRRLLPILIKPKSKDFKQDLNFYGKIEKETKGIVHWCLLGLKRLIENNWVLSESARSKEYLAGKRSMGNHFPEFMDSVFEFMPDARITTKEIIKIYNVWCKYNAYEPTRTRTLQTWLSDNEDKYNIRRSQNIPKENKRVRGYIGMRIKKEWECNGNIILT